MPDGPRYDDDFYAWTQYQAEVLRSMPCDDNRFDREHVAEEIEDLGKSERDAVRSQVSRIIEHLLKLHLFAGRAIRAHGWMGSIVERPRRVGGQAVARRCVAISRHRCRALYRQRTKAGRTGTASNTAKQRRRSALPIECPYTLDQILERRLVSRTAGQEENMTRDFIGYGAEPPHARWPGEARVAVNFVINFEEGSELSYPAGDGVSETGLIESASTDAGNRRDLAAESMFEYGSRVGWWRLHRIFTRYRAAGDAVRLRPGAGGEPAGRGGDRRDRLGHLRPRLSLDQALRTRRGNERDQIARAVALIRETTGKPTEGWYCRYAPSENTRRLVAEHGGFLYDSDAYNDELPYWVRVGDKPHLVIPYSLTTNDVKFGRGSVRAGRGFLRLSARQLRPVVRGRRRPAAHDVDRTAHAPDRASGPRRGADPLYRAHHAP